MVDRIGDTILFQSERDAAAWLREHPEPVDVVRLFNVILMSPYVRGRRNKPQQHVKANEQLLLNTFGTESEPAPPFTLPVEKAQCVCADQNGLVVEAMHLSGSLREGTDVRVGHNPSDVDVMFQLGPATVFDGTAPVPFLETNQKGVFLTSEPTGNPGFLLLKHVRHRSCSHSRQIDFSGSKVAQLLERFRKKLVTGAEDNQSGPALNTMVYARVSKYQEDISIDLVTCLRCGKWPHEEFLTRPRPSQQPSEEMVRRLCRMPIFMVPVGFPGSATETHEWRMSFSRQEYVVIRTMTENQRSCYAILKIVKAFLRDALHGALKSYFLKTALMWLCESRNEKEWSSNKTHVSLIMILKYIETCTRRKYMPCYFYPQINVLASKTSEELDHLIQDIQTTKDRLLSCCLALVAGWLGPSVELVAPHFLDGRPLASPDEDFAELVTQNLAERIDEGGAANIWQGVYGTAKRLLAVGAGAEELVVPFYPSLPFFVSALKTSHTSGGDGKKPLLEKIGVWIQGVSKLVDQYPAALKQGKSESEDAWLRDD